MRDCVPKPRGASDRGEFDLSAQRLHPSAQRQSGKLWRDAPPDRVWAEAKEPEVCQTSAHNELTPSGACGGEVLKQLLVEFHQAEDAIELTGGDPGQPETV